MVVSLHYHMLKDCEEVKLPILISRNLAAIMYKCFVAFSFATTTAVSLAVAEVTEIKKRMKLYCISYVES